MPTFSTKTLRRTLAAALILVAAQTYSSAQTPATPERRQAIEAEYGVKNAVVKYDTRAEMLSDINLAGGEYSMLSFGEENLTPAPKGYKPVYISHIGRHGARYAISDDIYEKVRSVLSKAHKAGKLTEAGEDLYSRYEKFYPSVAHRGGDLTQGGQEQLREIARRMYKNFPEVFKGKTEAVAISTIVPRVMMSMFSLVDELKGLDKDFSCSVDAGRCFYPVLHPNARTNPFWTKSVLPAQAEASVKAMQDSLVHPEAFCSRYFSDLDFIDSSYGAEKFESSMRTIIMDIQCLDGTPSDTFSDIFTPEELLGIWEVWNYNGYLSLGMSSLGGGEVARKYSATLFDMIEDARRDLEAGDVKLNMRFSHDTAIMPLLSFMGLDNFGADVADPYDVKNWWRCDKIPMATNLQLVFYRSRRNPEILVKVLFNGREASLPIPQTYPSFYSWTAFQDYYQNR